MVDGNPVEVMASVWGIPPDLGEWGNPVMHIDSDAATSRGGGVWMRKKDIVG